MSGTNNWWFFFHPSFLPCIRPVPSSRRVSDWHGLGVPPLFAWRLACAGAPPSRYSHVTRMLPALCFRSPADRIMPQRPDFSSPSARTYPRAHRQNHTCEPAMVRCDGANVRVLSHAFRRVSLLSSEKKGWLIPASWKRQNRLIIE